MRDTYEVHLQGIEQSMAVITKRFSIFKTKTELKMEGFADVSNKWTHRGLEPSTIIIIILGR